jgi:hypothetical protein
VNGESLPSAVLTLSVGAIDLSGMRVRETGLKGEIRMHSCVYPFRWLSSRPGVNLVQRSGARQCLDLCRVPMRCPFGDVWWASVSQRRIQASIAQQRPLPHHGPQIVHCFRLRLSRHHQPLCRVQKSMTKGRTCEETISIGMSSTMIQTPRSFWCRMKT